MADSTDQFSGGDRANEEKSLMIASVLRHAESGRVAELVDALEKHPGLVECKKMVACLNTAESNTIYVATDID